MMLDIIYSPTWLDAFTWAMILAFILAFWVSYGMGANDACNDWGTSVGAGTVKLWQAYILCAIFNTLGAILLGYKVTDTIRSGIIDPSIYDVYSQYNTTSHNYSKVAFCDVDNVTFSTTVTPISALLGNNTKSLTLANNSAMQFPSCHRYTAGEFILGQLGTLLGVAVFMVVSSIFKIPVSATHSIVGATVAFSLYLRGNVGIKWLELAGIVLSWFLSPVLAGIISSAIYIIIKFSVLLRKDTFRAALRMCSVFMFFTLAINLYAVIFDGSKYLGFDKLNWWQAGVISVGVGAAVGCLIHFVLLDWLEKRAIFLYEHDLHSTKINKYASRSSFANLSNAKIVDISIPSPNSTVVDFEPPKPKPVVVNRDLPCYKYLYTAVPEEPKTAKVFNALQMVSASLLSFSHGANDTANTVAPLVAVWLTYKTGYALTPAETRDDMQLLLAFGAVAMIAGFVTLGHRTIKLIAQEITVDVSAPSGFAVELGTALTVLLCAKIGIPISSTHCAVGSVLFVGMTKSMVEGVSWPVFSKIVAVWLLCFPISAAISLGFTWALMQFFPVV